MSKLAHGIALFIALSLAQAAAAQDPGPPRGECHQLIQQIARYEYDLERAKDRDNELWAAANERQIARLNRRLERRCPEHVPPTLAQRVGNTLDAVGRGALKLLPFLY